MKLGNYNVVKLDTNHQKKLKALKLKTPYTILLEKFDSSPELFKDNPYLKFRGLNKLIVSFFYKPLVFYKDNSK